MTFNFTKAKAHAKKALDNPLLELILLGPSGAGKSYTIGSLGVKTLYLYGTRESHGPKAASVEGGANVEPMCFDYGTWKDEPAPRAFTGDESWQFLKAILGDLAYLKSEGYKAIALDGMAVLEALVKETAEWREKCKTAQGKHNTFKETEATQDLISRVIGLMKTAQRELGVHIVVTGIIDVKETDAFGGVVEAAPRLQGYGLAESLNQHFGDITVVGKMTRNEETKYKLQFLTDLVKVAKDETGRQKKAMNFSPRLSGCTVPPMMDANLAELAAHKAAEIAKRGA